MTRIVEQAKWDWRRVRYVCVHNNLYTRGSNDDYMDMLDELNELDVTPECIYYVAFDILEHSETDMTVEDIMFELSREAIIRYYGVMVERSA